MKRLIENIVRLSVCLQFNGVDIDQDTFLVGIMNWIHGMIDMASDVFLSDCINRRLDFFIYGVHNIVAFQTNFLNNRNCPLDTFSSQVEGS